MISVIELTTFTKAAKKLLSCESVDNLKLFLSENPMAGVMIRGTGGLRKIRWSLDNNKGKSGGSRVIYYYHNERNEVALVFLYAKNEQENLNKSQVKILSDVINEYYKE